jgi:hypothetical protein
MKHFYLEHAGVTTEVRALSRPDATFLALFRPAAGDPFRGKKGLLKQDYSAISHIILEAPQTVEYLMPPMQSLVS